MIQGHQHALLLDSATTGTSPAANVQGYLGVSVYLYGAGTIDGGTVIIEEAPEAAYGGTWSQLVSVTASSLSGNKVQANGYQGAFGFVRVRISSDITGGGTMSAVLVAS